jgi:NO-binding membrane sensor protein with MHYT domain
LWVSRRIAYENKATMFLGTINSLNVKLGVVENKKKAGILIFAVGIMGLAIQQMFYTGLSQKVLKAKNTAPGCAVQWARPFIKTAVDFPLYCILSFKKI